MRWMTWQSLSAWPYTTGVNHVGCGHSFCGECWKGYLDNAVSDGPAVLNLRCPQDKCAARVTEEMARRYLVGRCRLTP